MRIGIDMMGGDFAPKVTTLGVIMAQKELPDDVELVLFGDQQQIQNQFDQQNSEAKNIQIVHSDQIIGMGEHPAKAFAQKPKSSIGLGFYYLQENKIDGFASAGNTGAMMVGSMYTVKAIPGIIRPCISSVMPQLSGKVSLILDVGINADVKPDVMYQYGILGSFYAQMVYGIENPRVALLNIGSETEKGNLLCKASHELMLGSSDFNFTGNVEGTDLFSDKADVIVCDGFTGNVVIKEAEAFYSAVKKQKLESPFFERFNFEHYGGTAVLGINAPVIIGHGISNDIAIKNMILHTYSVVKSNIIKQFKQKFK